MVYIVYIYTLEERRHEMNILIDTTSKEPLFKQIKEQIKQQIYDQTLQEGDLLPSIRQLAKDLGVSVITTKRAYEDLEQEGYVFSSVGKGTFVAGQQPHVLKEWQMREIENQLEEVIRLSQKVGLSKEELIELIHIYFEGGE